MVDVCAPTVELSDARADGGMFTVGTNGRVYPWRFDHNDARARYAAGATLAAMEQLGQVLSRHDEAILA